MLAAHAGSDASRWWETGRTGAGWSGSLRGRGRGLWDIARAKLWRRPLPSADVLVFPSRTETLGLVVLEAMAAGCPVVAARAGGITDIMTDGVHGRLFDPDERRRFRGGHDGEVLEDEGQLRAMRAAARPKRSAGAGKRRAMRYGGIMRGAGVGLQ